MIDFEELELELSSKCNAACPLCPREISYIKTKLNKVTNEITLDKLKSWLPLDFVKTLKKVVFKGTFSEPVIARDFYQIVNWFINNSSAYISIHTNGSLRKPNFWSNLGLLIADRGEIIFGIDGLSDTHSIYRVNTVYEKVIENATAFINVGGYAIWQYIVFKHNEHQITQAKEIAKSLNFTKFLLIGSSRFDSSETIIFNKKNQPLEKNTSFSSGTMNEIIANAKNNPQVNCESYNKKWFTIDWDGEVFPCCYGIGWKKNFANDGIKLDTQKWYKLILKEPNKTNLNYHNLDEIFDFLEIFYAELGNKYMLKTCAINCGLHQQDNNYDNLSNKILN